MIYVVAISHSITLKSSTSASSGELWIEMIYIKQSSKRTRGLFAILHHPTEKGGDIYYSFAFELSTMFEFNMAFVAV